MNTTTVAIVVQECGKLLSGLLPIIADSRRVKKNQLATNSSPVVAESLLGPEDIVAVPPEVPVPAPQAAVQPPSNKATAIPTGCIPCSLNHELTCAGLLAESMRFARKDGLASPEVIDRVGMCLEELSSMERVDMRPEMIAQLPDWEKKIAVEALNTSRNARHALEELKSVDSLEETAAMLQTKTKQIAREWYSHKINQKAEGK